MDREDVNRKADRHTAAHEARLRLIYAPFPPIRSTVRSMSWSGCGVAYRAPGNDLPHGGREVAALIQNEREDTRRGF